MSDEINEKTIALAVSTEKMTARVLRDVLLAYLRHRGRKSRYKATVLNKGKHTLKDLKKTNAELTSIEITDSNIKAFDKYARKYHVAYALKKDKAANKYYVFFRARDVDSMTAAFKEFTAQKLKQKDKPSVKETLLQKSILAEALRKKTKVKHKKREVER